MPTKYAQPLPPINAKPPNRPPKTQTEIFRSTHVAGRQKAKKVPCSVTNITADLNGLNNDDFITKMINM